MNIIFEKTATNEFCLHFSRTAVTLSRLEMMKLSLVIDEALYPVAEKERDQIDLQGMRLGLNRLCLIDKKGMRTLLREIPIRQLEVIAKLSEGNERLTELIYSNLSKRAKENLKEDIAARFKDPVPFPDIKHAVEHTLKIAQQLENDGEIEFIEPDQPKVRL